MQYMIMFNHSKINISVNLYCNNANPASAIMSTFIWCCQELSNAAIKAHVTYLSLRKGDVM